MVQTMQLETTVLPGHRLEIIAPEFPEGAQVKVTVVAADQAEKKFASALDFLESLPSSPSPRTFPTWEEYERFLREEKDSWER